MAGRPRARTHSKYREYVDVRETKTTSTIWNVQGTVSDIPFTVSMEKLPSLTYMMYNLI